MLNHSTSYYILVEVVWLPQELRPCNFTEMLTSHLYHAVKLTGTIKASFWSAIFPVISSSGHSCEEAAGNKHKMKDSSSLQNGLDVCRIVSPDHLILCLCNSNLNIITSKSVLNSIVVGLPLWFLFLTSSISLCRSSSLACLPWRV